MLASVAWVIYKAVANQLDEADKLASTGAFVIAALLMVFRLRSLRQQPAQGTSTGHVGQELEQGEREALDPAVAAANPLAPAKPRRRERALLAIASVVLLIVAVGFWTELLGPSGGASTSDGIEVCGAPPDVLDAFKPIEAHRCTRTFSECPLETVTLTDPVNGDQILATGPIGADFCTIQYKNIDFDTVTATGFELTYQSMTDNDPVLKVQLWLDDPGGPTIGEIPLDNTYFGGEALRTVYVLPIPRTEGKHDVYLRVVDRDPERSDRVRSARNTVYIVSFNFRIRP